MSETVSRRSSLLRVFLPIFFFAASGSVARSQTGLYGEFSASHFNIPDSHWGYGGGFGLYSDFYPLGPVKVGGDIRVAFTRPADSTTLTSILVGPRIALHSKALPLAPYAEVLVGPGYFSYGNNSPSTTQFDYRIVAGVDRTVVPHLDWRVAEFSWGGIKTYRGTLNPTTISSGLVLRF